MIPAFAVPKPGIVLYAARMSDLVNELVERVLQEIGDEIGHGSARARFGGRWDANVTLTSPDAVLQQGKSDKAIARRIDHTLLKPETTRQDIIDLCQEARTHQFASVCINAQWIPLAVSELAGTIVMPICVVGFPLGASPPEVVAFEAAKAVAEGAQEIDMVLNIGALRSGDLLAVWDGIYAVVEASRPAPVKVILETSKLNNAEKVAGCVIAREAGAHFVKTSTGFGGGGATVEDVLLMRRAVGPSVQVKASGGVRSREDALKLLEAGADRIGASASVAIVTGGRGSDGY